MLGLALLFIVVAYANAIRCEFVYDDQFEIVGNPYIQQDRYFVKAITSDVWAFKGERGRAWSNYWRPIFVSWMALNYRLFGLNVIGWHVLNILAHCAVVVMAYLVLRRLRIHPIVCAVATWLFAVHPTNVESVTWASGIPNMLMAGFVLASYLCYLNWRESPRVKWAALSTVLYLFALLSKEGMIVYPAIVFMTEIALARRGRRTSVETLKLAAGRAALFAIVAVVFIIARHQVLGMMRNLAPGAPGTAGVLATAPSVLMFYIRQMVWPVTLGMAYGLRAVSNANVGLMNFWLPLVGLIVLTRLVLSAWPRTRAYRLGLIWFILSIGLALDIRVFLPEELVHDRYLYMALFGGMLVISQAILDIVRRISRGARQARRRCLSFGIIVGIIFAVLTARYNRHWADEVALWARAVQTDPTSSSAAAQHGVALRQAGRLPEAKVELERALALNADIRSAHLGLGMIALANRQYEDAERRFRMVLEALPTDDIAREQLASCLQQQGRIREAIAIFMEGCEVLPYKKAIYSVNLAVLHRQDGRPHEAISSLESVRELLLDSTDPAVIRGLFFLAELYRETRQREKADAAYVQFIERASRVPHPELQQLARQAEDLRALTRP